MRPKIRIATLLAVLGLVTMLVTPTEAAESRFLTGPQEGDAYDIAISYIQSHLGELGLTAADLEDVVVQDRYTTRHNGVTHIYLQQRLDGVEVFNGILNVNVARDGSVISLGNKFVGNLAGRVNASSPEVSDRAAIERTATHFGLSVNDAALQALGGEGGSDLRAMFAGAGLSREEIPVRLVYDRTESGDVRLAWETRLRMVANSDWWNVRVDAATGEILSQNNWTSYDSYRVIPYPPFDNPVDSGGQRDLTDPADPVASPFGWHDTNGAAGAEFTDTQGNNVDAHSDLDGNNVDDVPRPNGGASLDFLFTFDENLGPREGTNLEAAIVNLFYANNVMPDVTYQYGFDEPSGNFQLNTYGNGGAGNDHVEADAQDNALGNPPSSNNANFSTPPDGSSGRMQMFEWLYPFNDIVTVNSPGSIAGDYPAASATFGGVLDDTGITGNLELVNDGAGGAGVATDACEALVGFTAGNIALMDRGNCNFDDKIANAEAAGATVAVVINDRPGILNMGGDGVPVVNIPSNLLLQTDGNTIRAEVLLEGGSVNVTAKNNANPDLPNRDSDMDNGIVAHEYGHGISNRLTGGPGAAGCLGGSEQAGEGWSDFWTTVLAGRASQQPTDLVGVGSYANFDVVQPGIIGIRNFPYTTDLVANPQTYSSIAATNVPHGVGEVWMDMVWEMYWELVNKHGFDPDFYNGAGGNNLTIQLVVDGMKLQPCLPDFVEARDAILMADVVNNASANQCEIWRAFAKRGLGVNATAGPAAGAPNVGDEAEDFTIPGTCPAVGGPIALFSDGFESGDTTGWVCTGQNAC